MEKKIYKLDITSAEYPLIIKSYRPQTDADDKEYFRAHLQEVWDILQEAYRGDFKGCASRTDFKKKCSELKIAEYNDRIVAVSVYNNYSGGNKCVGIGATRETEELHEIGKYAVVRIIKDDYEIPENWYWIEASGRIESICNDSKAIPVPYVIASQLIKKELVEVDEFHYRVEIGGVKFTKKMFGVRDKETFTKIKDYYVVRKNRVEKEESNPVIKESWMVNEYKTYNSKEELVKGILDYYIYLYQDELLRELPIGMMKKFDEYIEKMREIVKTQKKHPNFRNFQICLQDAVKCRKHMTLFEVHKI